jgi:cephalosporin hydroxylase
MADQPTIEFMQKSRSIIEEFTSFASHFDGWNDPVKVESFIRNMGINGEKPHELPEHLQDDMGGIRAWVMPNQTSKYISWLCRNGPFDSYIEIGSRHGGTFMLTCEALVANNMENIDAIACDIICQPFELSVYMKNRGFRYYHGSSLDETFLQLISSRRWGLCLIDGSHKYEDVMTDFNNIIGRADVIVMHDIVSDACPGVVKAWNHVKSMGLGLYHEFTEQYFSDKRYMGIGVLDTRISK